MGLLSDADILRCRADGSIAIEPFVESHMTPNGYDVSAAEVVIPSNGLHVKEGTAQIPPHARFAVGSRETVTLGPSIAGQIWLRTTWARRGVVTSFGMIDAGFSGNLTFGAFNAAEEPLALPIGDRFAQIIFFTLESAAASAYEARSGHYQGQRGVTLDRP